MMRPLARLGLAVAPLVVAALASAGAPLLTGCSGSGSPSTSSPPPPPTLPDDETCLGALGTPAEATACADSPLKAIADAQLAFTTAYVAGREQCAGTDVGSADGCYATSQCSLLQTLRDTEAPLQPTIDGDRYTGSVCQ